MNKPNQLIHESSPYLLQHAHNPVDWYPWGDAALQKAKTENKLLIVSVGYSACHWCHVMERESFEDGEVAALMNQFFVSVKVDREERPEVDHVYMNAAHLTSGHGGWPLNAIALPDGSPVFAATYFPKGNWMRLLSYFAEMYQNEPHKLAEQAEHLAKGLKSLDFVETSVNPIDFSKDMLDETWRQWQPKADMVYGGRKGAPKFMMPNNYMFLLKYYAHSGNDNALNFTHITLKRMAIGGLFDQIGGGFSRYSTDERWHVPHFEKMLYDNAQLLSLYALGYKQNKDILYKTTIEKTVDFLERELMHPEGGFYSALDADSEGIEGKYYVWSAGDMDKLLGADAELVKDYYTATTEGNWEHDINVLHRDNEDAWFFKEYDFSQEELNKIISNANSILFSERNKRIRPELDDKILLSWNALAVKGLVEAYAALGEQKYLDLALRCMHFLLKAFKKDNYRLERTWKNGRSSYEGTLIDYACLMESLITLYANTFDEEWLKEAKGFCETAIELFSNQENGMFYLASENEKHLISRGMETSDNVIPASNSIMATNLFFLGHLFDNEEYKSRSVQMLKNLLPDIIKNGPFYANWASLLVDLVNEPIEIGIVGKEAKTYLAQLQKEFLSGVIFYGTEIVSKLPLLAEKPVQEKTQIYICYGKACLNPASSVEETIREIDALKEQWR